MTLEKIRFIILIIGWPVLVSSSFLILYKAFHFYKKTQKLALGKFILAQTTGVIVSMYSLGIVSTAFMFCKIETGVMVVLPIFAIWFGTMIGIYYISEKWKDESLKINILYYKIKEQSKKLMMEKDKLSHIAQNMNTGAILLDNEGIPMFINREAKSIIGTKISNEKKFIKELYKKFSKYDLKSHVENCINGQPSNIMDVEMKDKLYEIYLRCLIDHNAGNTAFGHFIWIRDVTDEKNLEHAKDKFLTVISHKLRTPLSGIKGLVSLISNDKKNNLNAQQKDYFEDVKKCTDITIDLVNQLFYASEAEIKKMKVVPSKTDLSSLIKKAVRKMADLADKKNCVIKTVNSVKQKCIVKTDSELIQKAIDIILENAIIYSNNAGKKKPKEVLLKLVKEKDKFIISVEDKGIGIPETDKKSIFEKFYRSENALKVHTEGTGLNLNMAKTIIHSLNGDIWSESTINKGAKFFITIPFGVSKKKLNTN